MRSTPSLDRGRFPLPRGLFSAVATGATLVAAVLVVGWLAAGLIAGVWSPRQQVATVTSAAVRLAPTDRDPAPQARRSASPAAVPTRSQPTRPRPDAVRGERRSRRAPKARLRTESAPSPAAPAPVVAPAVTATPVAAAAPVAVETPAAADETSETRPSRGASEAPSTDDGDRGREWRPAESNDDGDRRSWRPLSNRGRDRHDGDRPARRPRGENRRAVTPTPTPAPTDAHEDLGHDRWDRERGDRRGRSWNR